MNLKEITMWTAKCEYCDKDIEEKVPCYPVYHKDGRKGYRHLHCYKERKEPCTTAQDAKTGSVKDISI